MKDPARALVIGLGETELAVVETVLAGRVRALPSADEAMVALRREAFAVVLAGWAPGGAEAFELMRELRALRPEIGVVFVGAGATIAAATDLVTAGADGFLESPLDPARLESTLQRAAETRALRATRSRLERVLERRRLVHAETSSLGKVSALIGSVAERDTTVLIRGETGTGKGLVAHLLHERSRRAAHPFVALNCAGFRGELIESELFGHERGAFTGAAERKLGLIEAAEGGTLFLDEIGEMDWAVQAKLLKVLEDKRLRRVGGLAEIEVDVRLVAATHRDLAALAAEGRFRSDLLYRLDVFSIPIPPLRERPRDVAALTDHFLRELAPGVDFRFETAATAALAAYPWPGNVRELRNVIERIVILRPTGGVIRADELPLPSAPVAASDGQRLEDVERQHLERVLAEHDGNIGRAAKSLGIGRTTMYRKIERFGIRLPVGVKPDRL